MRPKDKEKPTRSSWASGWFGNSTTLTGRRCTILVKFPVALLDAMPAKVAESFGPIVIAGFAKLGEDGKT